jgi:uncharacterized protein with von Willebrand factor type A (vWA) domain
VKGRLAENVMHFARALRVAGLPIGPGRVLDAVDALTHAGIERREDWHAVLSALFLTRHEQQAVFDQAFAVFWRDPELLEKMMSLLLPKVQGRTPAKQPEVSKRVAEALLASPGERPPEPEGEQEIELDATLTFSEEERLRRLDFEQMSVDEWRAAQKLVSALRLPLPEIATRRFDASREGRLVDLRATLRKSARSGDWSRLERRTRRHRPPPLVVLADISGSMHRYTRMFLHFVHALTLDREQVSVLLFGTRLTNVTRQLRHRDVDAALAAVSDAVPDWSGGTRIGACLREFNFRWSRRLLAQNACVLLVSDGLDREEGGALGEEMARLHRAARRLVWLNPLLRYEGFAPRASGIRAMLPFVDDFRQVHNIDSLAALVAALANPVQRNLARAA